MALTPGTRLGAYEVLALLGNGGMGEVYRARDTRLDRIVAIKILHPDAAGDPDRRQRLDREARAIASLNHPHICTLYDVGHQEGIDYLVMELLEGQTLAERLTRGALPLDQAMQYAMQLADALAFAHRHAIVHRDLKPANVFITHREPGGATIVKLLDFGIAKAIPLGQTAATAAATLTDHGTLLGTLQYMAPEQLEGRGADPRSDLFAFGAVLYEMLTGRRAFAGDSQASVIAAVLDSEPPPLTASQAHTPPALEHLVKTCLAKNPDDRWQAASDVKRQLEWIAASERLAGPEGTVEQGRGVRVTRTAAVITSLVALLAGGALTWIARVWLEERTTSPRVSRFVIAARGQTALSVDNNDRDVAITPDGTRIIYVGNQGTQLFAHALDQIDPTAIASGTGLRGLFVAPDGQWAGFVDGISTLKKVALTGGPVVTVVNMDGASRGATWAPDDTIVFATGAAATGLQRVTAAGGGVTVLTRPARERGESDHLWPQMLPGGSAVLFTITATRGGFDASQVAVLDLETGRSTVLIRGANHAHYVPTPSGHLVYMAGGALRAVPFDLGRLETRGIPVNLEPRPATTQQGAGNFDVATNGTLVYVDVPGTTRAAERTLMWVDRHGRQELVRGTPPRAFNSHRLSPDGKRVAVSISDQEIDVWVGDLARQTLTRLTTDPAFDTSPVWTRDGLRVIFASGRAGAVNVYWQAADGSGAAERLTESVNQQHPTGVSPDGQVIFHEVNGTTQRDLMLLALDGTRRVQPLLQTPFEERNGVVSPDGRWLVYESNASGQFEIYVCPFPDASAGKLVSTAGGTRPLWAPNGRELFYVAADGALMAVRVDAHGATWSADTPTKLFDMPPFTALGDFLRSYDAAPDGQRFLMIKAGDAESTTTPKIVVVQELGRGTEPARNGDTLMALASGTRLGAYEVLALLGNGGMGEVYRARDTRLDRIVAIKILHPDAAGDPDRRQRLDREARAIASLNHPHICTLYDVGHQEGIDYLVMELLEGQTLAERLTRGALPLDQAMQYAIQLADALAFAHRHGIVHRDLKPANVFITHRESGGATIVKLLDFGIAKAMPLGQTAATAAATLTDHGTLLGTLQYMAPEQLEGRGADPRSDLFAFGAVLYEMLTGRRAFAGDSQASVIAAVLDSEPPPLTASQARIPPALEHLVKTCLAKNPDDRWQAASDVKRQLEWIAASARSAATESTAETHAPHERRLTRTLGVIASLMGLIVVGALAWSMRTEEPTAPPRVTRTTIPTAGAAAFANRPGRGLAITPDGTRVVYIGNNGTQLFVRPIDRFESSALFTSVGPLNQLFILPDGKSIVFGEANNLKKIALTGGPAETIVQRIAGQGATWAPDDTIIFPTMDRVEGLQRISAAGGDLTVLTRPARARGELNHVWPTMLPGGRAVLFTITATTGGLEAAQVAVLDLVTGKYKVLVAGGSDARYVSSQPGSTRRAEREGGYLVYVKGSTLMAVAFDPNRLETSGTPVVVLPRLATKPTGSGEFDLADDGTLVYVEPPSGDTTARTLVWVDRQGMETPLSASLPPRAYGQPRVSPDGTRVAVEINDEEQDIWVWDAARQTPLRKLTSGSQTDFFAVWTADSRRLIFARPGGALFWQAADGTGKAEPLKTNFGGAMLPSGMTPDGTRVLFSEGPRDVMAMALDGRRVEPLVQTEFNERNGVVSPDGRWLAYESDRSGKFEIYVTPFRDVKGGTWPISTGGGTRPLWAPNDPELFFVAPDGAMMAVRVDPRGSAWSAGSPMKVFERPYATGTPVSGRNYDLSADGKRFLMVKQPPVSQATAPQIVMVQHWVEELKRLVPAGR